MDRFVGSGEIPGDSARLVVQLQLGVEFSLLA